MRMQTQQIEHEKDAWRDPTLPVPDRVAALLERMTLTEKIAQLYGVWVGVDPDSDDVAPHQHELADASLDFSALTRSGLGQLTRPFGTAQVDPADGAKTLARLQTDILAASRLGIPALFGYDVSPIAGLAARLREAYLPSDPGDSPMTDFDGADLAAMAADAGFVDVSATVEITLERESWLGPASWETLLATRPNPNAVTVGEALEQTLTDDERRTVEDHLRPLVEAGVGGAFSVGCFLSATRPAD
jgi:hypothetical protein